MPNGNDKVWVRTSIAIAGFKRQYGHWPTRLLVPCWPADELAAVYGGPERFQRIRERLVVATDLRLPGFCSVAVEDDEGRRAQYPGCGSGDTREVEEWIFGRP
jgi:hypothetical protein